MTNVSIQKSASGRVHFTQLDAVRTFAVTAVILNHWAHIPIGHFGVLVFFTLSGFLITRILLNVRDTEGASLRRKLRYFYIRRVLRIFPVYYLLLAVSFLVSARFRHEWIWYPLYLQNIHYFLAGKFTFASHFWSLAVEEQFYLCWPLLLFVLPRRHVPYVILTAIAIAPLWRGIEIGVFGGSAMQGWVLSIGALDSLGFGALLAYLYYHELPIQNLARWLLLCGAILFAAGSLQSRLWLHVSVQDLGFAMMSFWAVYSAALGFQGFVGRVCELAPILYLGKISYGIYLYHFFVPKYVKKLAARVPAFHAPLLFWGTSLLITLVVSMSSWHLFEAPLNRLKARVAAHV